MRQGLMLAALMAGGASAGLDAASQAEWLSLGAKHWAPTVISKSGIGSASATAEARVTRQEIEGWCANWSPGDRECVRRELASPEAKATYRASADCTRGRITAVDGKTYSLAGRWDNSDIGGGRTRWRDAASHIVGRDNASGGLSISQQWEVLCPEGRTAAPAPPAARPAQPSSPPMPAPVASAYAIGETVYARQGPAWIRGRVTRIHQSAGAQGPRLDYEVVLDNGQHGVVPARMLRKALR